jgi:hypothetical protein
MTTRPERDETERENWRRSQAVVQPPLDLKDRIKEAREILAKAVTKTKEQR